MLLNCLHFLRIYHDSTTYSKFDSLLYREMPAGRLHRSVFLNCINLYAIVFSYLIGRQIVPLDSNCYDGRYCIFIFIHFPAFFAFACANLLEDRIHTSNIYFFHSSLQFKIQISILDTKMANASEQKGWSEIVIGSNL